MRDGLPKPQAEESFTRCKLDHGERETNAHVWALHRDLLRLRREDRVFAAQRVGGLDGAVLGEEAFVLRIFGEEEGDDRLLLVNLGRDLALRVLAEPLLAPPRDGAWTVLWSSEEPIYGGCGTASVEQPCGAWRLPGQAALVLGPAEDFPTKSDGTGGNTNPRHRGFQRVGNRKQIVGLPWLISFAPCRMTCWPPVPTVREPGNGSSQTASAAMPRAPYRGR
ncbi:DUF3459 domain-containing protein [Azospirillum sp. INR13]|uniref:DUF3459 domain-containing protein n=1 Tax=Azospirillum sp. INR13 TaxID=2596919 RepID=UPI002104AA34|nr:DUF3459 domain-containing protein [Azospirillum sp. INR13]